MSFVLYTLGALLFCWAGYLLLAADTFASIDIAATLVSAGVVSIGLGAVVAAIKRLGRVVGAAALEAGRRPPYGQPAQKVTVQRQEPAAAREPEPKAAPQPQRPAVEPPVQQRRERAPRPEPVEAPVVDLGLDAAPQVSPQEEQRPRRIGRPRMPATDAFSPFAPKPGPRTPAPELAFEAPRIVAPALGGFGAERLEAMRRALATPAPEPEPAPQPEQEAEPAAEMEPVAAVETAADAPAPVEAEPAPAPQQPEAVEAVVEDQPAAVEEQRDEPVEAAEPVADTEPVAQEEPEPVVEDAPSPEPEPEVVAVEPAAPPPAASIRPPVPDWLARARARREARMRDEPPAPEPQPEPVAVEPTPEPVAEAAPAPVEPETPQDPSKNLVREGEHNGVMYRFFEDGSVEAESPYGVRRFGSVDELQKTIRSARGADAIVEAVAPDPEPEAPKPAPREQRKREVDPLDAAIAELEGGELRRSV